jgi:hypothetical protein
MTRHAKLPDPLAYLQPFTNRLTRLPVDSLHEDLDAEPLIAAIRKHFDRQSTEASACFRSDVQLLDEWLRTSGGPEHPAHWISGFLAQCELEDLFQEIPEIAVPSVEMTCPPGWKAESSPASLCVRRRGVFAIFTAVFHEEGWELLSHQWEIKRQSPSPDPFAAARAIQEAMSQTLGLQGPDVPPVNLPRYEASDDYSEVRYGDVFGVRHLRCQTSPVIWKNVSYLLTVPGGRISGQISTMKPGSFDQAPIEALLSTVRVVPPA